MAFWQTGYFLNFVAYPFLVAVLSLGLGRFLRWWVGMALGIVWAMVFVEGPLAVTILYAVVFAMTGLGGGALGWFIRMKMPRAAILTSAGLVNWLALQRLYSLTFQVHTPDDILFTLALMAVTTVLCGIAVFALPPDGKPHSM